MMCRYVGAAAVAHLLRRVERWSWYALGKVVKDGLVQMPHRVKGEVPIVGADSFPKDTFAAHFLPNGAKQETTELLDLVHEESQHHQHGKDNGQVLMSVAISCARNGSRGSSAY